MRRARIIRHHACTRVAAHARNSTVSWIPAATAASTAAAAAEADAPSSPFDGAAAAGVADAMVVTICARSACSLAHPRKASIAPGAVLALPPLLPLALDESAAAEDAAAVCEWRCFMPSARATAAEGGGSEAGWSRRREADDKEAVVGRDACEAR